MTKTELLKNIPRKGYSKDIINAFLREINKAFVRRETVKINFFGTFKVVKHNVHYGRNLKTGERITVSPRYRIKYLASKDMVKIINERNILEY